MSSNIRLLYGIESKAAICLSFNLHCKAIAVLFFIPYCLRPLWRHCPWRVRSRVFVVKRKPPFISSENVDIKILIFIKIGVVDFVSLTLRRMYGHIERTEHEKLYVTVIYDTLWLYDVTVLFNHWLSWCLIFNKSIVLCCTNTLHYAN